ncbi:type I restriction-modification system R subunit [Streptococcus pneumoniae]|nr:type I restriction-modification system R subunit [Streptococcus pneumoniae]
MIGAISGQEEVNQRPFTVGHFDLIIIDESHRSFKTISTVLLLKIKELNTLPSISFSHLWIL